MSQSSDADVEQVNPGRERPRDPRHEVSFGLRVAAWWSICFIVVTAALFLLIYLLNSISLVTITVSVAVMISALLQPAVGWLVNRGVPRGLAATGVFLVGICGISVLIWFVISQIAASMGDLQGSMAAAADRIHDWLVSGPLQMSEKEAARYSTGLGETLTSGAVNGGGGAVQTANSAVGVVSGGVLCLFATLFLLLDDGSIYRGFARLFPRHTRQHVLEGGVAAWRTLVVYMRSLVVLAALNALAMVPVMLIAGLPMVVPLAVLLFLGSLVPLVGVLVAGLVVCLVALVAKGVTTAIVLAVAMVLVVQLFGNLLNPIILGRFVDLHPLAILAGVTGGTIVGGIYGAFIAVPLVAVIKNVMYAVHDHHQETGATALDELEPTP